MNNMGFINRFFNFLTWQIPLAPRPIGSRIARQGEQAKQGLQEIETLFHFYGALENALFLL